MPQRHILNDRVMIMLLLKANPELQKVLGKLIKTMKVPVTWNDVIVIANNSLILAGDVRSLIFNFDSRKIHTNIIELPPEGERLQSLPNDYLLNNTMNMVLYVFGKWGLISGLKVDRDYDSLNTLFSEVLRPVSIEPDISRDSFRFFKSGRQITYEDALLAILRLLKEEGKLKEGQSLVTSDSAQQSGEASSGNGQNTHSSMEEEEEDYEIGLWHNMCWKKESADFFKSGRTEEDASRSRIGNNFYLTDYLCPKCSQKLYMGVYPVHKELLIDTEEGRVLMARAFACDTCCSFYTPRPKRLLSEGQVYLLKFDEDRTAYEDYLEILGSRAEKTTNSNFNEFENPDTDVPEETVPKQTVPEPDEPARTQPAPERGESVRTQPAPERREPVHSQPAPEHRESVQAKPAPERRELPKRKESADISAGPDHSKQPASPAPSGKPTEASSGMTRQKAPRTTVSSAKKDAASPAKKPLISLHTEKQPTPPPKTAEPQPDKQPAVPQTEITPAAPQAKSSSDPQPDPLLAVYSLAGKTTEELRAVLSRLDRQQASADPEQAEKDRQYKKVVQEVLGEKLTAKYDARVRTLNNLSARQLTDLKTQIAKEPFISDEKRNFYNQKINEKLYREEENALAQKIELSKNKSYAEIGRMMEEIRKKELPDDLKQETLKKLKQIRINRAEREVAHLIEHLPLHLDRRQLAGYLDKINQYEGVDITPYREQLDKKKDMAEKEEISAMIKRGGKKDRHALWNLYEQLQSQDYKEENKAPFLQKIYAKIQQMDEARVEKLCPSIVSLSFADGLKAYQEIEQGMFLPEIKTNALEMIQRRLTRLKTDECVQLMRKLKNDMEEEIPDCEFLYYYNAREEMKRTPDFSASSSVQADLYKEEEKLEAENHREAMLRAINGYAVPRGAYEYPLMVCDASRNQNGKEGFVLTPDHIFYRTFLNSGIISISDIQSIQAGRALFGKGVYVTGPGGKKEKLPNHIEAEKREAFASVLDGFIAYLQERPESRKLEYMAKETHDVKCCYRCGFVYKTGDVCPKCGSKMNQ